MISRERRHRRLALAGFVLVVAAYAVIGCTQQPAASVAPASTPRCGTEHDDFVAALRAYPGGGQAVTTATPVTDASGDAGVTLLNDATTEKNALSALAGSFGALSSCEGGATESGYAARAETALTVAAGIDTSLKSRLDQILGGSPALAQRVRLSLLRSTPSDTPFEVIDGDEIYTEPNLDSPRIAALRKGQRVTAPEEETDGRATSDWIAINLNDGSIGYVRRAMLRALQTAPIRGALDPVTRAAQIITQALPQKEQEMWSLLSTAGALNNNGL